LFFSRWILNDRQRQATNHLQQQHLILNLDYVMHPVDAISQPMTSMPGKVQTLDISVVVMGYGKPMVPNPMFP
jgi:hypothetical protein